MTSPANNSPLSNIDARTVPYGLIGDPVRHSLSPQLYNSAFDHHRLNCCYLAFEVDAQNLSAAVNGLRALGIGGFNVTAPYKEEIISFLDEVSREATLVRSVNTVVNHRGSLQGYTTDGPGFCRFLKEDCGEDLSTDRVLVIGAGGAARAVAFSLAFEGIQSMVIANRTLSNARELARLLEAETSIAEVQATTLEKVALEKEISAADLVVNSLAFDVPEVLEAIEEVGRNNGLKAGLLVDLRYNPEVTEMMKNYERQGGRVHNGKGMLFWQAVMAFEHFFPDLEAPVEVMRRAVEN